jgi:serine O-acetyltransferase
VSTVREEELRRGDGRRRAIEVLREDWQAHQPQPWRRPSFHALAVHRMGEALEDVTGPARRPLKALHFGLAFLMQAVYGMELPFGTKVGRRVTFAHHAGIVIAPGAVIGDECLIRQNVTIGGLDHGGGSPRLGKGVRIGAGAVVAGEIEIGDGVTIGPNAVVTMDIPAGATVLAPPARIVAARPETASPPPEVHGSRVPPSADAVVALVSETLDLSAPVGADTPLFSSGLVDSLNVALLLDVIESHFGVAVPPEKVATSEFDTAREIAALLRTPE